MAAGAGGIRAGRAFVELFVEDSRLVRGLRQAQRRLQRFGAAVRGLGTQLSGLGALMGAPLIAGTKVFADFEQQMAQVSTMLQEPDRFMDRFRSGIREMSAEFGESTDTLAQGLYDILSASVPAEQALEVLAISARAAKAGITDTGTAADAITTVLNAYGLSADRAASVSDFLFAVVKRGKTTFGQLAPSIGRVASIAASAGLSLDELGAAIATLTRNGVQTEQAMSAIGAVLATFLKPADESARAARELGFEMSAATLQSEGLYGVAQRLAGLPPDALARIFPNVEALRGLLPLLNGLDGFGEDLQTMQDRAGATGEAYDRMAGTLTTAFARIKQSGLGVLSVIGEALAPLVHDLAARVSALLTSLRTWVAENQGLVVSVAQIAAMVAGAGFALLALGGAASLLATVFGGLATAITAVGAVLSAVGAVLGTLLTPIGAVIAGVVALGTVVLTYTQSGAEALAWLGEGFTTLHADAMDAWQGIADALAAGNIALAAQVVWAGLKLEWQRGSAFLLDLWDATIGGLAILFTQGWYGLQEVFWTVVYAIADAWDWVIGGITRLWNEAVGFIAGKLAYLLELLGLVDEGVTLAIEQETQDRTLRAEGERRQRSQARQQDLSQQAAFRNDVVDSIRQDLGQGVLDRQAEVDQARSEFDQLLQQARDARAGTEAGARSPAPEEPTVELPDLDRLTASLESLPSTITAESEKLDVTGSFTAAAIGQIGLGDSASDRTAKASEQTATNTTRMVRLLEEGGMEFA